MPSAYSFRTNLIRHWFCIFTALSAIQGFGQVSKLKDRKNGVHEFKRTIQVSLFPGISTNGIRSASFRNDYSLNVFGGLSNGNRILELSPITNVNLKSSSGIQLAGLANIIGPNSFVNLTEGETLQLKKEKSHSSMQGIQLAGLLNYVLDTCSGFQMAGALNVVGADFKGIQLAGLGNSAGESAQGLQLSSLYNIAHKSMGGFQISTLFNYTDGSLSGFQFSLVNKSGKMAGKNTTPPTRARGWQVGLLNFCKEMDGVQIGLLNFGGTSRGKQIGLVNFFSGDTPHEKDVRNGTPIGLLNFGGAGSYIRVTHNELFAINVEKTSGNCLNCSRVLGSAMPFSDDNQIFNQNALIAGYDPTTSTWGFGYGFQKNLYNKFLVRPHVNNRRRVMTYGIKFMHLNRSLSLDKTFNLLSRLNFDYGKRFKSKYIFVGLSINYFLHDAEIPIEEYKIKSITTAGSNLFGYAANFWPGYEIGIQF